MDQNKFLELFEQDRLEEAIREINMPFQYLLTCIDDALHEKFPNISFSCFDFAADLMCMDACDDGCAWISGSGGCCVCLAVIIFAASGGKCCFPCIDSCRDGCC